MTENRYDTNTPNQRVKTTFSTGQAEPLFREALRILRVNLPDEHHDVGRTRSELGECLWRMGKLEEAESELLAGAQIQLASRKERHFHCERAMQRLIDFYVQQRRQNDLATWTTRLAQYRASGQREGSATKVVKSTNGGI